MKSKIEEFCKSEFDSFLRDRNTIKLITWENVAQINEPPDYYLFLDKSVFAVEVSMLMENVGLADRKIPRAGIIASYCNLIDKIKIIAESENYLKGAYIVHFSKPLLNFYNIRNYLKTEITRYIKLTKKSNKSDDCVLYRDDRGKCSIKKIHNNRNYISLSGLMMTKWEGEAQNDIKHLLQERILEKKHKLRNINEPKILLLYDVYYFASKEMFKKCITDIEALDFFNTLFIIQENNKFILHSKE